MGHLTHRLASFDFTRVGSYETYVFMFYHEDVVDPHVFGTQVGADALALAGLEGNAGWLFLETRPPWLNSHVFLNATVFVICKGRDAAAEFQRRLGVLDARPGVLDARPGVLEAQLAGGAARAVPESENGVFDLEATLIVAIPRAVGWDQSHVREERVQVMTHG